MFQSTGLSTRSFSSARGLEHLARLECMFPLCGTWTRAYTDGSAEEAVKNAGSGVYIRFLDGKTTRKSVAIGTLSTNFRAEACALLLAAQTFSQEDTLPTNTVFLTDCKSILQSLQAPGGEEILRDIRQELNLLKQRTAVVLQWIPSHCGIGGNEKADRLSKAGSKLEQQADPVSYSEEKLWRPAGSLRWTADYNVLTGLKI
ncbi:ribonuclease H-like [Babylonia areolata]|uniref:ribonuclease H-like n=1 Tax=Babylonia areolata TaxID=304850 RepID=UPI003FD41CB3